MQGNSGKTALLTGLGIAGRAGRWDMTIADGRIASLTPAEGPGAGFVMPLGADVHVHLDKTLTVSRMPERATSLFHAIELMQADFVNWNEADLRQRAQTALSRAYLHGTAAMRSHVDWHTTTPPLAWSVLHELAADWQGRIELQLASLTSLDLFADIGAHVAAGVAQSGGILGAFVYRNDGLKGKLATLFDLAEKHDLHLDIHVDEGLDEQARGLDAIISETAQRGMAGRVLCGHACALSVREPDDLARTLDAMADAGVGLVVLPGANSYLQDGAPGRTPRLRGLAPLQEASAAGVSVMLGSDNVQDCFFPYGDYDLIDVLRNGILMGHLVPERWLDAISARPAGWMGHDLAIEKGGPASFIHFDEAALNDVVSRPGLQRHVWRNGTILPKPHGGNP